jgi:hypothetical protein
MFSKGENIIEKHRIFFAFSPSTNTLQSLDKTDAIYLYLTCILDYSYDIISILDVWRNLDSRSQRFRNGALQALRTWIWPHECQKYLVLENRGDIALFDCTKCRLRKTRTVLEFR